MKRQNRPKHHAYQRAAERLGLHKAEADRLVKEAFTAGKQAHELDGPYKTFLMFKGDFKKLKIYKDIVFVFNKTNRACITMYPLSQKLINKQQRYMLEKEISLHNQAILNKKIERNNNMKKQTQSKYLGLKFLNSEGQVWTVVRVSKTSYNNYRFNLSRDAENNATKTISITSKTMKKLATSYLTIEDILAHKEDLRKKNINTYRNTSWYTWSEAKSCK